jgi:hypothetical protein
MNLSEPQETNRNGIKNQLTWIICNEQKTFYPEKKKQFLSVIKEK